MVVLTIPSRRVPFYAHYLEQVLQMGRSPIYERHATEADFFGFPRPTENTAGPIRAAGDDTRLIIQVLIHMI